MHHKTIIKILFKVFLNRVSCQLEHTKFPKVFHVNYQFPRAWRKVLSSLRIPGREVPSYLDDSSSESGVFQVPLLTLPLQHTLTCPVLHLSHLSCFCLIIIFDYFKLFSTAHMNELPTEYFKPGVMYTPTVLSAEVWSVLLHFSLKLYSVPVCMHACLLNRVYVGTPRVVWLNPRGFTSVIYGKINRIS